MFTKKKKFCERHSVNPKGSSLAFSGRPTYKFSATLGLSGWFCKLRLVFHLHRRTNQRDLLMNSIGATTPPCGIPNSLSSAVSRYADLSREYSPASVQSGVVNLAVFSHDDGGPVFVGAIVCARKERVGKPACSLPPRSSLPALRGPR